MARNSWALAPVVRSSIVSASIYPAAVIAVAIPAVVGYNWLTRANRVLSAKLDAFAYELHTFVSMGQPLGNSVLAAGPNVRPLGARPAAA